MAKVIAIANQKGGVAKTTTTAHLGWGLAKHGKRVLAIDFDPQGNLTMGMGVNADTTTLTVLDWLGIKSNSASFNNIVNDCHGVDLLPANILLDIGEMELNNALSREKYLDNCISEIKDRYDYILIDCRPSLSLLTINALTAADEILVPVKADYYSIPAVEQLISNAAKIRKTCNPKLIFNGFLVTMLDTRRNTNDYNENFNAMAESVGSVVYKTQIRLNSVVSDVPSYGMSLFDYKPNSIAAVDYMMFVEEFLKREVK